MGLTVDLAGDRLSHWLGYLRRIAENASVPVAVHLDHAVDIPFIRQCIDGGFSSVMFDGSVLPLEENIRKTSEVVAYAHRFDVTVEAQGRTADCRAFGDLAASALSKAACCTAGGRASKD